MKKILISDYDGTFYQNDIDIKKNIDKVNEFRTLDNLFVLATGRSYVDLKQKIDKYEIPYDYLILNHGALLLSKDLEILKVFTLDKELVDSLLEYVSDNKDICDVILISTFDKNVTDTLNIVKIMLKIYSYEESQEVRDKLLDKVEKTSTKAGVLRNEVKTLNDELKEVKEHSSIVEDKVTQTEDISTSDIDNPNVQQTEEIIDRIKNSTIGKLGKKKKERK